MAWTPLKFGKHKDKTLPQILFVDPDWFFWAIEDEIFNKSPALKAEADDLNWKAQNILIPRPDRELYEVEYFIHPSYDKFSHFDIVLKSKPLHAGSSHTERSEVINMNFPRFYSAYDKSGCKRMLKCLKIEYFNDKSYKMSKDRCESFFDDDSNFAVK